MTSDNVLAIDVLFADGSQARLEQVKMQEAMSRAESETLEGNLYRKAIEIRASKADAIKASWPRTWRRASGYGLNYLLPWSASRPPMWARAGAGDQYPPVAPDSLNLAPLYAWCPSRNSLCSALFRIPALLKLAMRRRVCSNSSRLLSS
jgi:hypothetical protein